MTNSYWISGLRAVSSKAVLNRKGSWDAVAKEEAAALSIP